MAFKDFAKATGLFLKGIYEEAKAQEERDYQSGRWRYEHMSDEELRNEYRRHKSDITSKIGRTRAFRDVVNERKAERENAGSYSFNDYWNSDNESE